MPDLSQALRVSEVALEPYRMRVAPIAGGNGPGADWFGPLQPQPPGAPKEVAGRRFDFPPGFNLQTRPRAYEPIGFWELRALADNYDLLRLLNDTTFKYAGTLQGGTTMGTLSANFPSGSDPDTVDTLSVNLTESQGVLLSGTQADADQGYTLCLVDNELVTYEQASLTSQYNYNLGKNGTAPGYLRRGLYGTAIAAHSTGASFARLREGSYFTIGYDSADIGQTIYVKLLSFNQYGGGKQTLDQVSSYSHTLAAPPVASAGLLPGIIQTPDMALDAATAQLTVSAAGPITLPASPANATLVSGTLTTIGQLVQVAYNAQFTNTSSSAVTIVWRVTYQGVNVLDSAGITVNPGVTATVAKQTTYTPGAQSGVFAFIADMVSAVSPAATASYVDLSVTELRR